MKLTAKRFRTRRPDVVEPLAPKGAKAPQGDDMLFAPADDGFGDQTFAPAAANTPHAMSENSPGLDLDAIRREGLTGRQLRLARRMAQKHDLPATSDFDAVRLLRQAGHDPFQRTPLLDLVRSDGAAVEPGASRAVSTEGRVQLPQTVKPIQVPSTEIRAAQSHMADIMKIQRDLAARRRRKMILLCARLAFFVLLPTLLTGFYFFAVATPLYATKSEFVIQQSANPSSPGGLGGLLSGSPMATSQDSITVQGYLQSREAMQRLDKDFGFRQHFSNPDIDPIQRLDPQASSEAAYKLFKNNMQISYDPTEGVIKMEVIATDPATSATFSKALIGYAEEQVDHLTQRMREDQMQGAREQYESAEADMLTAQRNLVELQEKFKVVSSEAEVTMVTAQMAQLQTQLTTDKLSLDQMQSNAQPNPARTEPLKRRIAALENEIETQRAKLTVAGPANQSLAQVQSELLIAQADVQTRQLLLGQSLAAMQTSQQEANRQVRYLSVSVNPIAPDEATYPRAFENTVVALLIFAGIYLMISMTAAILREQVSG